MPSNLTVQGIRTYVRLYFDVDTDDMPDTMIDRWISEGWGKIVRFRPNWPGFESTSTLAVVAGTHTYTTPFKDIASIEGPDRWLVQLGQSQAEQKFIRGGILDPADKPVAYSVYRGQVRLWPTPNANGSYVVRGQRAAINPLDQAETLAIDLPHPDAVEMLVSWVMYRAALREAENETAAAYLDGFSQGMQLLAKDETDVSAYTPIVLNSQPAFGGNTSPYLPDRLRFDDGWE